MISGYSNAGPPVGCIGRHVNGAARGTRTMNQPPSDLARGRHQVELNRTDGELSEEGPKARAHLGGPQLSGGLDVHVYLRLCLTGGLVAKKVDPAQKL